jgi:predicted phage-related endonuclease
MTADERLAWLRARQDGIGASDAPNLVGVGFRDAHAVYLDKTTPPAEFVPEDGVLARGIALEGVVAERYARYMDAPLFAPTSPIVTNPRAPWQFASPDRLRADDGRPVQLKTVAGFGDEWGPNGSDEVPDNYRVQVCQETGCLGADSCDLAALDVIAWELRVYRLGFDEKLFDWLTEVEHEFWTRHVVPRVPPSLDWEARFDPRKVGLIADRGTRVDLSAEPGALALFEQVKEIKAIKDEAEEAYTAARAELALLMGRAERADCGPWTVKKVIVGEKEEPARPARIKRGYSYLGEVKPRKETK